MSISFQPAGVDAALQLGVGDVENGGHIHVVAVFIQLHAYHHVVGKDFHQFNAVRLVGVLADVIRAADDSGNVRQVPDFIGMALGHMGRQTV